MENEEVRQCEFCNWYMIDSTGQGFCCNEKSPNYNKGVRRTDECRQWEKR